MPRPLTFSFLGASLKTHKMEGPRNDAKRRRHDSIASPSGNPDVLTVHSVTCDQSKLHQNHPAKQDYMDIPRLFEGDSKASPLRGTAFIRDIEETLDENNNVSIVVHRNYSCNHYHDEVEKMFDKLDQPKHPQDPSIAPFFFYLRGYGKEATPETETVQLVSDDLKQALVKLTGMEEPMLERLDDERNMSRLYNYFYFYRGGQLQPSQQLEAGDEQHISMFQQFMETLFAAEYDAADALFAKGKVNKEHFRKLFAPDDIIVTRLTGEPRAFTVDECHQYDASQLRVTCKAWGFDGGFFQEKTPLIIHWDFRVPEVNIDELEAYPLRFNRTGLADKLRRRGERFWECRQRKYVAYKPPSASLAFQTANPRFMVDAQTYQQIHSKDEPVHHDHPGPDVADENPPDDDFLLLLPATIRGFGFHDKKWQTLLVDRIIDIPWNKDAFNHLVLRSTKKQLIEALIASHSQNKVSTDVIEGKGNGLILLLHGGPGTGKTLTAESVAELTYRPLYRVTCGDIGTNAEDVEGYLETVFYLGTKWNCVVLLDEADIFLEERSPADLARNALVSVFLRVLEYYEGILILTSNRIGTFDEAFKSRVHLTLHYPPLRKSGRRRIWTNFITGIENSDVEARVDELKENIDRLSCNELNGREIRNAIKTATLLAQFRKEVLGYQHLLEVIKVSDEFERYLTKIHGHSSGQWAKEQGTRAE